MHGWLRRTLDSPGHGSRSVTSFDTVAVCPQSSQGSTLQSQPTTSTADSVITPSDCLIGTTAVLPADFPALPPGLSVAASKSGIHRENGVTSDTSVMYQTFWAASQRAPRALTVSFSAKGVARFLD